jgi:hypothetical protein
MKPLKGLKEVLDMSDRTDVFFEGLDDHYVPNAKELHAFARLEVEIARRAKERAKTEGGERQATHYCF